MDGVTVCVTTYRRPTLLQHCIRSLFDNRIRPIEIVVSDNDFSGESAAAVRVLAPPEGIVIRHMANPGPPIPSQNVMNAFSEASHERLVLMHDDDFMMPGGIDALAEAWERFGGDAVDAVYGRRHIARADGRPDLELTRYFDDKFFNNDGFGPQESGLWAALAQQFPCNGMMIRKSIALRVGYPREADVGRDPTDFHFGIRYAQASHGAFVLIDHFVSTYRLSEVSMARAAYEDRVYDGHLGYAHLERLATRPGPEREAKEVAMGRIAPLALAGYLKAGDPRAAARVFFRNHRRMEKGLVAKVGLLALVGLDLVGFRTIDRHGVRIRKVYDYFYRPRT
jgi:glycosyltransferase involved in cell wall biosynthesis